MPRSTIEDKVNKRGEWSLGVGTESRAFEVESWSYVQHKNFQLHILQKADKQQRIGPPIATTESERLAYYRAYTTSPFKIQIVFSQLLDYTGFFWLHVKNVLLKSLSTNYIHMFLAAYNLDIHLFGARMIPICYGMSWQVILCGMLQLVANADFLAITAHFAYSSFIFNNPWSRCWRNWTKLSPMPKPYKCYSLKEFCNITGSLKFAGNDSETSYFLKYNCYYIPKTDTLFTMSFLDYFLRNWKTLNVIEYFNPDPGHNFIIIFFIIWIVAALFYKQLYKKYLWKLFYRLQILINIQHIATLIYIVCYSMEININKKWNDVYKASKITESWDFDFQAESISGPPVVHVLTSRASYTVRPGRDSILMTASNSLMYVLKGLVYYKLKEYAEYKINAPVYVSPLNPYPFFYLWSLFWSTFRFGPTYTRLFYTLNLLSELLVFILTYQILIEVIVCEWKWAKRWVTTVLISLTGLTLCLTLGYTTKMLLYVFTTAITSLTEVVVICWLYPGNRLMDDIYFHCGARAQGWWKWSTRILPCYFIYKTYVIFKALIVDVHTQPKLKHWQKTSINADFSPTKWVWAIGILPLPLGALFAIFKYIIKNKETWRDLFNPRPDWGPREHLARQLRKQFDSREYVGSQSSRYLCRHLMSKALTSSYRLDVCYDAVKRRSTIPERYEGEWKNTEEDT